MTNEELWHFLFSLFILHFIGGAFHLKGEARLKAVEDCDLTISLAALAALRNDDIPVVETDRVCDCMVAEARKGCQLDRRG